jgi:general secretion pathway protein C
MGARIAAFVIWAAVAASAVYWALQLWTRPSAAPAHAGAVSAGGAFRGDLALVLGVDEAPPAAAPQVAAPPADAREWAIGVVAPRAPGAAPSEGVALIATEGKAPKAYRVGAAVDGELVLQAVHGRGASLGLRGQPAQVDLQLPPLPLPSTGSLPPAVAIGSMPRPAMAHPLPSRPGSMPPVPQALPVPLPLGGTEVDGDADTPSAPAGGTRAPTVPQTLPSALPHGLARPPA